MRAGDEESSEESEKEEEEEPEEAPQSRFTNFKFESSSESEEEHRTIKTMKDKRIDAFRQVLKEIRNHAKINDFSKLTDDFGELNKELEKSKQLVEQEGIPKLYFKGLVLIEDCINEINKKTLSTLQLRAWNTLKNRLKKHNKDYETQLEDYRKNPIATDEEEEKKPEPEESEEEEEKAKKEEKSDEDEENEDENEDQEGEDESEESESEEEETQDRSKMTPEERRKKWVKKDFGKKPEEQPKPVDKKPDHKSSVAESHTSGKEAEKVDKIFKETVIHEKEEFNYEKSDEGIKKYILSLNDKRGRSGYDPLIHVRILSEIFQYAKDLQVQIDIIVTLLKVRFEATQILGEKIMTYVYWKGTADNLFLLLKLLRDNPQFVLKEAIITDQEKDTTETAEGGHKVQANTLAFLESLDNFLTVGLKNEEARSDTYVRWLKHEVVMLQLAEEVMDYYKAVKSIPAQVRVALILLDRLHYKHDSLLKLMREKGTVVTKKEYFLEENMKGKIENLASLVYEHGNEIQKIRAALYHIFHHALHGRYHEARDLFVYSRMSQQHLHDIRLQIYYNRALVQLGLAAFQCGYTDAVLECLGEMVATTRLKELLAQGVSGRKDKSAKQDQEEAKRLLPYHTHINTDLIEATYLISAMLVEVPAIAKRRHTISEDTGTRHFRKVMQEFERRNVLGIPHDTVKDQISRATQKLHEGNWQECYNIIEGMSIWRLQAENKQHLLSSLKEKIKAAGLLSYVHMSLPHYDSYSLSTLAKMFELDDSSVSKSISKVILI